MSKTRPSAFLVLISTFALTAFAPKVEASCVAKKPVKKTPSKKTSAKKPPATAVAKAPVAKAPVAKAPVAPLQIPNEVSHWNADANSDDSVGKHALTLGGEATYSEGVRGRAFHFDGKSQWGYVPYDKAFDVAPDSQWTLAAWVKPEELGKYQAVMVRVHKPGIWEWGIIIDPSNHFYTGHDNKDICQSKTAVEIGKWTQAVVSYNAGTWTMSVNGVQEATASDIPLLQGEGGLSIAHEGEIPVSPEDPDWFGGSLDEIHFYNRALTPAEIAALYKSEAPKQSEAPKTP